MSLFGIGSGILNGVPRLKALAATAIRPQNLGPSTGTITATASQYYYAPIYLVAGDVFTGAWCYNQSAGDTGKKIKIALWLEASGGGLGARAKDFGEVTLTAAAASRLFASSYTVTITGWHFLGITSDSNPVFYGAVPGGVTAAGSFPSVAVNLPTSHTASPGTASITSGYTVAGTYANFPEATGLAPTSAIIIAMATGTSIPDFGLYKT